MRVLIRVERELIHALFNDDGLSTTVPKCQLCDRSTVAAIDLATRHSQSSDKVTWRTEPGTRISELGFGNRNSGAWVSDNRELGARNSDNGTQSSGFGQVNSEIGHRESGFGHRNRSPSKTLSMTC